MPALIPVAVAGIGALASVKVAGRQGKSNDLAVNAQTQALDESMKFEREKEQRRRQEYDAAEKRRQEEYDRSEAQAQQAWDAEQSRAAPYREAAESLLGQIASRRGVAYTPSSAPAVRPPTPRNADGSVNYSSAQGSAPVSSLVYGQTPLPGSTSSMPTARAMTQTPTGMPQVFAPNPLPNDTWLSELMAPRRQRVS